MAGSGGGRLLVVTFIQYFSSFSPFSTSILKPDLRLYVMLNLNRSDDVEILSIPRLQTCK